MLMCGGSSKVDASRMVERGHTSSISSPRSSVCAESRSRVTLFRRGSKWRLYGIPHQGGAAITARAARESNRVLSQVRARARRSWMQQTGNKRDLSEQRVHQRKSRSAHLSPRTAFWASVYCRLKRGIRQPSRSPPDFQHVPVGHLRQSYPRKKRFVCSTNNSGYWNSEP
jgi:hypothetical protein